jgi:hypothetical protein
VHHSKSKIKNKKPPIESSEEEQESFQVAKCNQRSNKRQPKALVSSDEDEETPKQAESLKKRESYAKVTPSSESRGKGSPSSESSGKAITPDSEEEADCFEATIPNSSPIVQHGSRPKTPVFNISIKDEAEESYHVKRSIDLDTSDNMDQEAEETEQSYPLLKASKQLKKSLISKSKSEAEDSPLKPTSKRTGKLVIRSSEENSAANSEAEASASMESSVDSARSPSPEDSFPKSNKKNTVKQSRKALQTSSSDGMESSFEKSTSTRGARPARNIESDDTEEESGFNPQSTPATLVKPIKNIESDDTEDESSGYNSRYQEQSSSKAGQTLHQMLKTSMERQDSGNDSGMEQLSIKVFKHLIF